MGGNGKCLAKVAQVGAGVLNPPDALFWTWVSLPGSCRNKMTQFIHHLMQTIQSVNGFGVEGSVFIGMS